VNREDVCICISVCELQCTTAGDDHVAVFRGRSKKVATEKQHCRWQVGERRKKERKKERRVKSEESIVMPRWPKINISVVSTPLTLE